MSFGSRAGLALALFAASAALPAFAVVCVDPGNASCQPTIQAGVNAAAVGEVVQVAGGLYNEAVAIATQGLVLRGGKGVFIDPSGLPGPAHAISITAANVAIESLAIRNGENDGIRVNNVGGTQIRSVDIQSPDDFCIELDGTTPNVVIENSRFRSCGLDSVDGEFANGLQLLGNSFEGSGGVDVTGGDVRAERNTFGRSGGTCLSIEGASAVVTGNRFELCSGGITIDGDDASLTRNTLTNTEGSVIEVDGDDPVVESNSITGTGGTAIDLRCEVSCGAARIYRNRLANISGTGIAADSLDSGLRVEANQISQVHDVGIALDTLGATVLGNRVTAAGGGGDECIALDGEDNTITGNGLTNCGGDGIKADGDNNAIADNRISGSGDDGIDIAQGGVGNEVLENQASGASDHGIEISEDATGNTVSDNRASGLRADYCDEGIGTGGTDVPDATTDCDANDD